MKLGDKVTICLDEAGKHPRRIGFVKRIGLLGSWRLGGTGEWYALESGKRVGYSQPTTFARPYEEGDEEQIKLEDERERALGILKRDRSFVDFDISRTKRLIGDAQRELQYLRVKLRREEEIAQYTRDSIAEIHVKLPNLQAKVTELEGKIPVLDAAIKEMA